MHSVPTSVATGTGRETLQINIGTFVYWYYNLATNE